VFLQKAITSTLQIAAEIFVPGHTALTSPTAPELSEGDLFCGDTLFAGGCGRLFEGSPAQMVDSLSKLRSLPDNTRVWCHEYTLKNLQFALPLIATTQIWSRFASVTAARSRSEATVPSMLSLESARPFCAGTSRITINGGNDPETFARLRRMKDRFGSGIAGKHLELGNRIL